MKRLAGRIAPILFVALASIGIYACSDSTGPDGGGGDKASVTVQPVFQSAAAGVVSYTRAHIVVHRSDGSVALDTTIDYTGTPPGLQFQVALSRLSGVDGETLSVEFDLLNANGTVFHGGPVSVHADPDVPATVSAPTSYTGVGASATRVEITPSSTSASTGATVDFTAKAFGANDAEIPGTPVQFSSVTPSLATVPNAAVGRAVIGTARGTARIRATLVTGQTADATVNVSAPATTLAIQSGNNQTLPVGSAAQPLVVKVTAADGLGVGGISVAFAIQSGGGTLAATQATTDADGLASVGYTLSQQPGPVSVQATAAGLSGSPATFSLTGVSASVTQFVFVNQPTNAAVGASIGTITVEARDQANNKVTSFTGSITLSLDSPPAGVALQGTATVNAVAGVATFSGLTVSAPATGLRLRASSGTVTGNSGTFNVTGSTAASLAFTTLPPAGLLSGDPFTIVVQARDAAGNLAQSYSGVVTLSIDGPASIVAAAAAPPPGVTLDGNTSVVAVGGVATFNNLRISNSASAIRFVATGTGIPGTASTSTISVGNPPTNPLSANPGSTSFTVQRTAASPAPIGVQITATSPITGLAAAISYGPGATGWLAANLSATSTPSTLTLTPTTATLPEGTFTATVNITGSGGASLSYSVSVTVTPLPVAQLAVITEPAGAITGFAFTTQPVIELQDATGTRVLSASNSVTASVNSGTGALTGTLTRAAVQGRVTFTDLKITGLGAHTLAFASTGLTGATSASFTVAPTPPTQIAANGGNNQTAIAGSPVATAPSVLVRDANNNPVANVNVTFAIGSGGGSITGPAVVATNASGIATVGGWTLGTTAGANTLTATVSGLTGSPVTFSATGTAGPATQIAINAGNGQAATVNTAVTTPPSVIVRDANNNPVSAVSVTFAVASGGGAITGASATTNAAGIATVGSWTLGTTAGANTLTATSAGLTGSPITFTATGIAGAGTIAINGGNSQSAVAGSAVATAPSVIVRDGFNNPISGISVTFAVGSGGGSVTGASATTDASGIATVGSWTLGTTAGSNTLTATSAGLSGSPLTFSATGTAGPATQMAINAGNNQSATVAGTVAIAPSVRVSDANNNPVAGVNVTFAVATGGGSISGPATVATNASGIATVGGWTLGNASGTNNNTLTATSAGLTGSPLTFTASANAGPATTIALNDGNAQTATVNTTVATPPSVLVTDAGGNPKAGVTVTFTVASGGGSVTGGTALTNASGIATVGSWKLGTTAGANSLTATSAGLTGSPVTFTATGTAGAATQIAVNAGNGQTATVNTAVTTPPAVMVRDAFNNVVAGVSVTFAVASGGGSVTGGTATTNASGIATVGSWTLGTTAGSNSLTATSAGLTGSPVTFTATGTAGAATQIAINAGDGQAATVNSAVATPPSVIVRDAFNNPKSGVSVTFAVGSGGGSVTGATTTTNGSGVAAVGSWTLGTTAGANTLTATSSGLTGSPVTFTATGIAGSGTIAINAGNAQTAVAGTAVTTAPSVIVRDGFNNPISNVTVTFTVATGGGSVTGGSATTNASGIATVGSWTLGATAGSNSLTAASPGLTGSPLTFTATGTAGAATQIAINAGNNQSAAVASAVAVAPSVIVRDVNNNPVSGVSVTFAVTAGGGSVTGGSATTNASGIATVGSWTLGNSAGSNNNTMTATSAGLSGSPVTFTASATAGAATTIALNAGNNQTATVNTNVATNPSVFVTDAGGNPKAGVNVTFAVTGGGGGIVGSATVATNASGIATVGGWRLGTSAGTSNNTLTATSAGLTGSPVTFTASATAGNATQITLNGGNNQTATVSTAVATAPSVLVRDAFNNPKSGVSVTFAVTAGGGSITGGSATTNASGIATVGSWTLGATAGANTLTATSAGLSGSPVSFTATGTAGAATQIAINSGDGQSATVNANVATAPSVIVRDANNNPVSGVSVTFAVTGGGGSVTGGSATTNASGIATVTSWRLGTTAGTNTLSATSAGLTGSPLTFTATGTAGTATQIAVNDGNNQSAAAGTAVTTPPSVVVKDAFGNPKSGVSVTFSVFSGGGSITGASATTNASGIATVGSWTLGSTAGTNNNTLRATSTGLTGSPVTFTASATAGAATQIALNAGNNQTVTVNTAVTTAPSVIVRDASNNPVSGVSVTFAVTAGGGSVTGASATTNASGIATVGSWTLGTTAGTNTLTATSAGLTGSPVTFTATGTAGNATQIAINGGNGQSATVNTTVATAPSVIVRDAFNNPKSGVSVTFAVTGGGGSVLGGSATTNASGIATVTSWTMGTTAGTNNNTLSATSAGLTGSPLTFTASATAGNATQITLNAGNNQSATTSSAVAVNPSVLVRDAFNNPKSGVTVTFAVTGGGGSITGGSAITNASGIATVGSWTLGAVAGTNTLTASSTGLSGSPVTFTATGVGPLAATQAIPTITLQAGTNFAAAAPVTASGGTAPYVFALTGGTLPAGMSFNTTNGQLSGTPTAVLPTTVFTVTVTDNNGTGTSAANTFSLTVNAIQLLVNATSPATFTVAGGNVTIPLNVDMSQRGGQNLASLQVTVNWDPTKFQFISESVGNGAGWSVTPNTTNAANGSIILGGLATVGSTTDFTFHNVTLKPLTTGAATVTVTLQASANELAQPVVVAVRNLTATINP